MRQSRAIPRQESSSPIRNLQGLSDIRAGHDVMISAELAQITNCFLGDAVLADRVNGATRFHAIELHIDAPYLFYQPVNDRARGERPCSKNDNGRHGGSLLFSNTPLAFAGPTPGHTPTQACAGEPERN